MPKAILLIHGMGPFTAPNATTGAHGSFGTEFLKATTETLQQFANHKTDTLENYYEIHEFNYSEWFDQMRAEMAKTNKATADKLAAISGLYGGASIPLGLATKLSSLQDKFGGDSFFATHWLDVIFYGEMLGAAVRVNAAAKIAELVEKCGGANNVHIVAHSLGTAVIHDTLALLYGPKVGTAPHLDLANNKLGSLWMFANVSGMVDSVTHISNPLGSVVKPGDNGCTAVFFNARHKLDPFTWLAQFDPQNNESWVPSPVFLSRFQAVVTEVIIDPNTHSFTQYLQDPRVVASFYPFFLDLSFKPNPGEVKQLADAYVAKSLTGAYAAMEDSLAALKQGPGNMQGWFDFVNTVKTFGDGIIHVKSII